MKTCDNKQLDINCYISRLAPIGVILKISEYMENEVPTFFKLRRIKRNHKYS